MQPGTISCFILIHYATLTIPKRFQLLSNIYAGMFLFCARLQLKKVFKKRWNDWFHNHADLLTILS